MPRQHANPDVLVIGSHPAAYLAATVLAEKKVRTVHATVPDQTTVDRLVIVNPKLFALHKSLAPLERKLDAARLYGLRFLASSAGTASEYRTKSAVVQVAPFAAVQAAMASLAQAAGAELHVPASIEVQHVDERGAQVALDGQTIHPKALIVTARLPEHQRRLLAIPDDWGDDAMHRRSFAAVPPELVPDPGAKPLLPMSLDLDGRLCWGWLLRHEQRCQLTVQQPLNGQPAIPPHRLLAEWGKTLHAHGLLRADPAFADADVRSVDVPLAGALAHEGVGNRALLAGPAGGFYSACGEDVYPNCWSALYAADVLRKALKETHLQDALNDYRHAWRTTLGDYLRGPQQNLRFLLPLVYRNEAMTGRLAESILLGKSVVR